MHSYKLTILFTLVLLAGACKKNYEPGGGYQEPAFLKIVGGTEHPKNSTRDFYTYYLENGDYVWTVPPDAQILSAQGRSTIRIKFGVQNGKVTVKAKDKEASLEIKLK